MEVLTTPYSLVSLTPPKELGDERLAVKGLLQTLDDDETVSLELAALDGEILLLVRSRTGSGMRRQLALQFGGYGLRYMAPDMDPMKVSNGEQVWTLNLGSGLDPRHLLNDRGEVLGGSPLAKVIRDLSGVESGGRAVARMVVKRGDLGSLLRRASKRKDGRTPQPSLLRDFLTSHRFLAAAGLGIPFLGIMSLYPEAGWALLFDQDPSLLLTHLERLLPWGLGLVGGLGAVALLWAILKQGRQSDPAAFDFDDLAQVEARYMQGCYDAQIQLHVILPDRPGGEIHAYRMLSDIRGAYRGFERLSGSGRMDVRKSMEQSVPSDLLTLPGDGGWRHPGYVKEESTIGPDEASLYFHAPQEMELSQTHRPERNQFRRLAAPINAISDGAAFGTTTVGGTPRIARLSDDTRRHHQIVVGASRQGKSTFMLHNAQHEMIEKANGRESAAVTVVDPHGDLVSDLLKRVPYAIRDRVKLLDLGNADRAPGINVLDTRTFRRRERAVSDAGAIVKGLWPKYWGPLMQDALNNVLRALYEANSRMPDPRDQYTLIDAGMMFKHQTFRDRVLSLCGDQRVRDWWMTDYAGMSPGEKRENTRSIRTRLAFFANSVQLRSILGQPVTTLDIGEVIDRGEVLLVSTGRTSEGSEVGSLVGSTVLHIVNGLLMLQGELPPEQRKRLMLVIDEIQSIMGVDFSAMGGETNKFGCAMIMCTQSLPKLDELDPPMRATILANMSCLSVLRSSGDGVDMLAAELGSGLGTDDIRALHPHHAYVRVNSDGQRYPAYLVVFNQPPPGDPRMEALIRRDSQRYTTPVGDVERLLDSRLAPYIQGGLSKLSGHLREEE